MTEPKPTGIPESFLDLDSAMAVLEEEQRKVAEISRVRREETTTVQAKDHSFEMTFDGSGELTDLKFNGSKYRNMAPAKLASLIVDTLRLGRAQSMAKMTQHMTSDALPGVDIAGLVGGKVEPSDVLDSLISPMFDGIIGDGEQPRRTDRSERDGRHG